MLSYLTSILTGILFRLHTFFSTNLVLIQLNYNKISLWLNDPFRELSAAYGLIEDEWNNSNNNITENNQLHEISTLDLFFDGSTRQYRRRDYSGQILNGKDGFKYRINVHGFKLDEIAVDLEGEDIIVIQAEHKEERENESIEHLFRRRFTVPKDIQKAAIKCTLDGNGRLVIFAPKISASLSGDPEKRSVPIEFKNL